MRRAIHLSPVDMMLLGTVFLWALNVTVTKYVLDHGFHPLGYATIRYGAAGVLFWSFTYARERSFRIRLSDTKLVALAGTFIFLNQLCFVYGVKLTSASTVGLLLGTTPIFIGILSTALGLELRGDSLLGQLSPRGLVGKAGADDLVPPLAAVEDQLGER